MMRIKQTVVGEMNTWKRGRLDSHHTIQSGRLQSIPLFCTDWEGGYRRKLGTDVIAISGMGDTCTKQDILTFLDAVDGSPAATNASNYRNIINDANWRAFYHASIAPVNWNAMDHAGNALPAIGETGMACWSCGICLPLRAIQVDHSRPRAGEHDEAVAKFFRHQGLTIEGPAGAKGRATIGIMPVPPAADVHARYTLSAKGRMILQIIMSAAANVADLKTSFYNSCLNSYANLRPLCAQCNTARNAGPQNKF